MHHLLQSLPPKRTLARLLLTLSRTPPLVHEAKQISMHVALRLTPPPKLKSRGKNIGEFGE